MSFVRLVLYRSRGTCWALPGRTESFAPTVSHCTEGGHTKPDGHDGHAGRTSTVSLLLLWKDRLEYWYGPIVNEVPTGPYHSELYPTISSC